MRKFKLSDSAMQLLAAQVHLNGTFNHSLRSVLLRHPLTLRLKVERSRADTLFTVEMGTERHSLTLPNSKKAHLKLAALIEEIANGPSNLDDAASLLPLAENLVIDPAQEQHLYELVRSGGMLSLEVGYKQLIHVGIHHNQTRKGITAFMSTGSSQPRTTSFTLYGSDTEIFRWIIESIHHLATAATSAAHAT